MVRVDSEKVESGILHRFLARRGNEWVPIATCRLMEGDQVQSVRLPESGPWVEVTSVLHTSPGALLSSFVDTYRFEATPDWSYSPHVNGFNPDGFYKAPVILTQSGTLAFGIVPDLNALDWQTLLRSSHALDLDVPGGPLLRVGFLPAKRIKHSDYQPDPEKKWESPGTVVNRYYLYVNATATPGEAYRDVVRFHWEKFGRPAQRAAAEQQRGRRKKEGEPQEYSSLALWGDWRKKVWDEETATGWLEVPLPGGETGGAVRMVRWQSPQPSVYLSSWFNSLRTALGMALYATRERRPDLLDRSLQTLRLALSAPGREGAFKCAAVPATKGVEWAAGDGSGAGTVEGYLGYDMSWTGYWMLRWRAAALPGSDEILSRCSRLAGFLVSRQAEGGMLPTRFREDGTVDWEMSKTVKAETGPVVLFLLSLYEQTRQSRWLIAAKRGLEFLEREVIPLRQWYDYETFWSCSPRTPEFQPRTAQWPANNLALGQTVAAYLKAHQLTRDARFLARGESLLDYLLLYQQCWTNPALKDLTGPVTLLGGFTTMNADGEWSDARQSQFGNVLLDYYRETGKVEYLERGVAALRAQFPVSPSENWAHIAYGGPAGTSSFHWGTGSGMAGIEIEETFLRDCLVDLPSGRAVGVNGLDVAECRVMAGAIALTLTSPFPKERGIILRCRGSEPEKEYDVTVNGTPLGMRTGASLSVGLNLVWRAGAVSEPPEVVPGNP